MALDKYTLQRIIDENPDAKLRDLVRKLLYDEIVGLIDKDEFTADPIDVYENKIYCKSAPMKTAVIWNRDFIDVNR